MTAGDAAQVVLVRHGRTAVNAQARLSGRHDPDLDELGREQAAAAGAAVAASLRGPVTVVSSPLRRCLQTAGEMVQACAAVDDAAAGEHHRAARPQKCGDHSSQGARGSHRGSHIGGAASRCSLDVDDRFIELDYGDWDGRPLADVPAEAWQQWRTDPEFRPPGGETLAAVSERVVEGLEAWVPLARGGTLVVVSHVSPIKAAVVWALGVGEDTTWRMRLDNASLCRLDVSGGHASLRSFNETAHLIGTH